MKILFVSDVYFPRVNGVSTSIETFRRNLRAMGHTVDLIAPDYLTVSDDETGILRVPSRKVPLDPEDRFMSYEWVMKHVDQSRAAQYDVIHIQTPFVAHYLGVKLSRVLGIPCVETYHTFFEEYLYHYIPFIPRSIMRFVAKRFSRHQGNSLDGMVVPSNPMMQILNAYGISTPTEVIPTGMEPESFVPGDRATFREKYGIALEQPVLLFVGRVAHEKNIGFLIQVLEAVRRGRRPMYSSSSPGKVRPGKASKRTVIRLGLDGSVRFIGYLDRHKELNSCYCAADLFIFSSRTETQGLVLLEAMAQGVPVVSTAELGTRDVLREGLGVHIAQEDVADFAGKVITLLNDAPMRQELGDAGREYAQTWSASRQAQRMLAFYLAVPGFAVQSDDGSVDATLGQAGYTDKYKINSRQ